MGLWIGEIAYGPLKELYGVSHQMGGSELMENFGDWGIYLLLLGFFLIIFSEHNGSYHMAWVVWFNKYLVGEWVDLTYDMIDITHFTIPHLIELKSSPKAIVFKFNLFQLTTLS